MKLFQLEKKLQKFVVGSRSFWTGKKRIKKVMWEKILELTKVYKIWYGKKFFELEIVLKIGYGRKCLN